MTQTRVQACSVHTCVRYLEMSRTIEVVYVCAKLDIV